MRIISILVTSAILLSASELLASPVAKKEFLDLYRAASPALSKAEISLQGCTLSTAIDHNLAAPKSSGKPITRLRAIANLSMYDLSRPVLQSERRSLAGIAKRREISPAMISEARTFFEIGGSTRAFGRRRAFRGISGTLDTLSDDEIAALLEKDELLVQVGNRDRAKACTPELKPDEDRKSFHALIQSLEGAGLTNVRSLAAYREPESDCAIYGLVQIPKSFGMIAPDKDELLSLFQAAQNYKRAVCPDDTTLIETVLYAGTDNGPGKLCNGELIADFKAGENKGWAPFLGVWQTIRETNNPIYPGADEEVTLTLSLKPDTTAEDAKFISRKLSRVVIKDNGKRNTGMSFGNSTDANNLRGGGFIEGVSPNIVAMRIDGDVLHYVGYSPDPGCVVMDFKRVK